MSEKKKSISAREFHERMKALRNHRPSSEFVEKFNKIMEEDEKREHDEQEKEKKKIARPLEVDL